MIWFPGEHDHLFGHVGVTNPALGCREVLDSDRQVGNDVVQTVLGCTQSRSARADSIYCTVDRRDGGVGICGHVHCAQVGAENVCRRQRQVRRDVQGLTGVGADEERQSGTAVVLEHRLTGERRARTDRGDLSQKLSDLSLLSNTIGCRRVGGIDGQLTHTLQDRMNLVECTLSGLHEGNAVLSVPDRLTATPDLSTEAFRLCQTSSVISCTVDTEARRELLESLTKLHVGGCEIAERVERRNVLVDTHGWNLLVRACLLATHVGSVNIHVDSGKPVGSLSDQVSKIAEISSMLRGRHSRGVWPEKLSHQPTYLAANSLPINGAPSNLQ